MSKQEKALFTRRAPKENLAVYLYNTPYEFMRSLKHSDIVKIGRKK